jgi:hypothetical protein
LVKSENLQVSLRVLTFFLLDQTPQNGQTCNFFLQANMHISPDLHNWGFGVDFVQANLHKVNALSIEKITSRTHFADKLVGVQPNSGELLHNITRDGQKSNHARRN